MHRRAGQDLYRPDVRSWSVAAPSGSCNSCTKPPQACVPRVECSKHLPAGTHSRFWDHTLCRDIIPGHCCTCCEVHRPKFEVAWSEPFASRLPQGRGAAAAHAVPRQRAAARPAVRPASLRRRRPTLRSASGVLETQGLTFLVRTLVPQLSARRFCRLDRHCGCLHAKETAYSCRRQIHQQQERLKYGA